MKSKKPAESLKAAPSPVLVHLQLSGDPKCLALVRRILSASATSFPVSSSVLNDLKLAVTEACTNVIRHAFKYDFSRNFSLNLEFTSNVLKVRILYSDRLFDPEKIPIPDLSMVPEGGLGVFIIRKIMDEVVYSSDRETGEVVLHMIKFLHPTSSQGG